MNATSEPSIMMDSPVLIPLPNFHLKVSLPSDIAEFGTFRDTENYIIKNTHVCCAEYAKSTIISETVYVIPSGNCEVEMMLLPERQMKNIWTGVFVPMEHRQTTMDLSAISTEALSQYQTVFFWHTECYLPNC